MRKLMWFTVGFGAACAFCAYFPLRVSPVIEMLMFLGFAGVLLAFGRKSTILSVVAVILLGIGLGLGWGQLYSELYLSKAAAVDGTVGTVTAYSTGYSYQTDSGCAVEGRLYLKGKPFKAKFYIHEDVRIEPGDVIEGTFELRATTADSQKGATFHQGKGMFLLAYQKADLRIGKVDRIPIWAYPAIMTNYLTGMVDSVFRSDSAPFAKALLLGDRSDLDYELNTAFKVSGIMHIIAVSGLHVTILFSAVNLLFLKRRGLVALFGIPLLFLFAAVAGFTPSVTRACIMQALMIGAMLMDKEYDGPTELAFSALVMLLANPLVITSVSFQLSVGCMIGILLFQKPIYDWFCRKLSCGSGKRFDGLKRGFAGSVSMTLAATSLTTPLSAYYFGAVSLVGIVTNLLTLWVVSFTFCGIMLACIVGFIFPNAGAMIAELVAFPVRYVIQIAQTMEELPFAAVYTQSVYIVAWLVFCYILLAVFLFMPKKQPFVLMSCMFVGLLVAIGASCLEPKTDSCRITVLDVGQGQSVILQSADMTYVVDCGGDYDEDAADLAAETLLSQGIKRIDGLILTHFDRDHAGGAVAFLNRIDADEILIPDYYDDRGVRMMLEAAAGDRIVEISEDIQIGSDGASVSVFAPQVPDDDNESSLAVLFRKDNCDILITGDRSGFGERLLLKSGAIPELDVLVVGHHGSQNSTCIELLEATRPRIAAISVGENSYGHPSEDTLKRLEEFGCIIYRTDMHGNLIFRR